MSYESPEGGNDSQMPFSIFALFYQALRKKNLYGRVDSVNTLYTLSLLTVRREIIMLFFYSFFSFVCVNFFLPIRIVLRVSRLFFHLVFPAIFFLFFFLVFPAIFFFSRVSRHFFPVTSLGLRFLTTF